MPVQSFSATVAPLSPMYHIVGPPTDPLATPVVISTSVGPPSVSTISL